MLSRLASTAVLGAIGTVADALRIHRPTILCLHSVVAAPSPAAFRSALSIDVGFVCALAAKLRARGVPVIAPAEAIDRVRAGRMAPFVVLTFDDGYRDNYDVLFRAAVAQDIPITVFVTTGLVDREVPMWWHALELLDAHRRSRGRDDPAAMLDDPALVAMAERFRRTDADGQRALFADLARREPMVRRSGAYDRALTWDMLREMARSPLVTIGAHTVRHPMLSSLSREDVTDELVRSRRRLEEQVQAPIRYLAYPFGQPHEVGPIAADIGREAGYDAAFTTEARPLAKRDALDLFRLPRILLSRRAERGKAALAHLSGIPAAIRRATRTEARA